MENFANNYNWRTAGLNTDRDNGNGSLIRISPLLFPLLYNKNITDPYSHISNFSSLTHAHKIAIYSYFIYIIYAKHLDLTKDAHLAHENLIKDLASICIRKMNTFSVSSLLVLKRLIQVNLIIEDL
ncbi:ADP-ribosylglycohydrolase family protein [Myroides injenensis]|uniref:ADP-ribosylglycohydrolase family protein n=1 Tax=Myroides injenensis TaxID=1183151 RepID=UPI001ED95CFA|nr:ADP-ribosylglycohydrolase family protein [Myroides injenensis]